ncbi:hypothetical protein BTVI_127103 [Pitangus sulphuratus]|nr:hypothetical protein BTVI_127103 [Pitangus sulphuratus]
MLVQLARFSRDIWKSNVIFKGDEEDFLQMLFLMIVFLLEELGAHQYLRDISLFLSLTFGDNEFIPVVQVLEEVCTVVLNTLDTSPVDH